MRLVKALFAVCALPLGAVAAEPPPALGRFEWRQALRLERAGQAVYRFELPAAVHAGTRRPDLGDLRIFNGAGEVVPHAFVDYEAPAAVEVLRRELKFFPIYRTVDAQGESVEVSVRREGGALVSTRLKPKQEAAAHRAGYVIDVGEQERGRRALLLAWASQPQGTVLRVKVESGGDLQHWREIAQGSQLVDLVSGDQRLRQNRIDLAADPERYVRILWPEGQEGVALSAVTLESTAGAARPSRLQWSSAIPARPGAAAGEYLFESPGLPVAGLRFQLPQRNTVAAAAVFHRRDEQAPWQAAGRSVTYRLSRGGEDLQSPPLQLCCSSDRYWRVLFDQRGGGLGAGTLVVELGWQPQQGLFVARGAEPFLLAYGSSRVASAGFLAASLVPGYRPEDYPRLPQAGFAEPIRQAPPPSPPQPALPWRSLGLWSVLVAGVLLLGLMVWRLLAQLGGPRDAS